MGYHITLARPEPKPDITPEEWREFVRSRPELTLFDEDEESGTNAGADGSFVSAMLDGCEDLCLHYINGSVFTKNPEGPRIIEYMASIAPHFDAVVTGSEGETYSSPADWGTQADWDRPVPMKTFWQRELTLGNIIRMTLLLLFVAMLFYKHYTARR